MPVYKQSYRRFEGGFRRRFRWVIVADQELRVLATFKLFKFLVMLGMIQVLLRFLQVLSYDVVMQDPNHPLAPVLRTIEGIVVSKTMFFDFIRLQAPLVFLMCLYAGAGMICNDVRNNLMEVYFSKPLRWYDYALGKVAALMAATLSLTALPGLFLLIVHNMLMPGEDFATLRETWWWAGSIVAFSLVIVTPCLLGTLASSALMSSLGFASVAIFMVLVADSAMAGLLAALLHRREVLILSFPMALNRIGQALFRETRLLFDLRWEWAALFMGVFCLWAAWVVFRRVRRAEVAA